MWEGSLLNKKHLVLPYLASRSYFYFILLNVLLLRILMISAELVVVVTPSTTLRNSVWKEHKGLTNCGCCRGTMESF